MRGAIALMEVGITVPSASSSAGPEVVLTGLDAEALEYGRSILESRMGSCPGGPSEVMGYIDGYTALFVLIHPRFILGNAGHQNGTRYGDARVQVVAESYKAWVNPAEFPSGIREVDLGRVSLPAVIVRKMDGQWEWEPAPLSNGEWPHDMLQDTYFVMSCGAPPNDCLSELMGGWRRSEPAAAVSCVRGWLSGRLPARRS